MGRLLFLGPMIKKFTDGTPVWTTPLDGSIPSTPIYNGDKKDICSNYFRYLCMPRRRNRCHFMEL
ncbi:hypothetical protein NQ317_013442 [Molorchus minor]|uniref:Uncharacterized protein n=1 Tax=Molorchus minor TaxID=1323400 RepID=A0ABQ9IT71_9CUCU|nr:hypothetical protein NQ317_013442 [Molorchus minor]